MDTPDGQPHGPFIFKSSSGWKLTKLLQEKMQYPVTTPMLGDTENVTPEYGNLVASLVTSAASRGERVRDFYPPDHLCVDTLALPKIMDRYVLDMT